MTDRTPEHLENESHWFAFRERLREINSFQTGNHARHENAKKKAMRAGREIRGKKGEETKSSDAVAVMHTPRQSSTSSTLSTTVDSTGGGLVLCTNEIPTKGMVDMLMSYVMRIWNTLGSLEFYFGSNQKELFLRYKTYIKPVPPS